MDICNCDLLTKYDKFMKKKFTFIVLVCFLSVLYSQNQKVINNKDTLYVGCANHVIKPKGAEKFNCYLQFEGENQVTPGTTMASFLDYGKKIYIAPPHEGLFSMDYGKNDTTIAVSVIYSVVNPPTPTFEVDCEGVVYNKDNVRVIRGKKVRMLLKTKPKIPITDNRYRFSGIKLMYYKDIMQSVPSKTEEFFLSGTGKGFELDTKLLQTQGYGMVKIQVGEIQRIGYNQEKNILPLSRYDMAINIHFREDTLIKTVAVPSPPRPPVSPTHKPKPVSVQPVVEIPKTDILYLIDNKGKIPPSDIASKVETMATVTNLDSVMRMVNFPVIYKKLASDNTVTVKVLVDENGKYNDHIFVKESHSTVNARVSALLPLLRFIPATYRGNKMRAWVNIPIEMRKE